MSQMIRVMLADDHAVVRSGLKRLLEQNSDIEVVAEAESGEVAYQKYAEFQPDVVVMDMTMPGIGGLEALRRIIAREKEARIVIFSMHDSVSFAMQAMTAGATGYVVKSGDMDDMVKAVRHAAIGKTYFCSDTAQKVALSSVSGDDNPMSLLSAREFEVFCFLAEGMVVEDIAQRLSIGQKTVANYQTILKNKLGVHSAVDIVRLALKYGVIQQ